MDALVHPKIRHEDDTKHIVDTVNPTLARDGYALQPNGRRISGYSIYTIQVIGKAGETPADQEISVAIADFGEVEIHRRWQKALERRSSDPEGAITAARSLIETTCKHILDDANIPYADDEELPKLYGLTAGCLNLAPSQHTADAYKRILGSCQSVVESLATIRNKMSDAHGVGRKAVKPLPRHAELAVNLSGSMCMFLIETWQAKKGGG